MLRSSLVLAALLALGGCVKYVGVSAKNFRPATRPEGIWSDLRFRHGRLSGELLEAADSGLFVLANDKVVFVPLGVIRSGVFAERGTLIYNGRADERAREELRLLSRFPAGLSRERRTLLLAAYGQTEPEVAR